MNDPRLPQRCQCKFPQDYNTKKSIMEPESRRLGYDVCTMDAHVKASVAPGLYRLHDRTTYDNCFMEHSGLVARNLGPLSKFIDTESNLKTLNAPLSKCPEVQYSPLINCKECVNCNSGIPCGCDHCNTSRSYLKSDCNRFLIPTETRLKRATHTAATKYIDRFENLCVDVQNVERIQSNDYIGQNTRIDARDATSVMTKNLVDIKDEAYRFKDADYCGPEFGISTTLECLYKKDKNYTIFPRI
jgi:hypothetical protein